ncbi:MAG TPA: alpha/beta hydrolase [Steroidobacteraceae bacterium]|nr:alpha/beta hydrolase [Steroidobacteraceae bacterium]
MSGERTGIDWRDGGQYARLTDGLTFWRREGAVDGVPIVLIHGATVPSWEFDFLVPPLLAAGFQALRFDLYAHGASDRPAGRYDFERFTRQVIELIDATAFPRPAILLGHSFGASLAAAVAAARPELVGKLVLVAPMLDFASTSAWATLFRIPALGEIAMSLIGTPALVRRRRRRYAAIGQEHLSGRFVEQVADGGFGRGLVSMFRHGALGDKTAQYTALRDFAGPLLVVTGDHDNIIPPEHIARVRALLPPHAHCPVPAEHNLLLTHPDVVVKAITRWVRG